MPVLNRRTALTAKTKPLNNNVLVEVQRDYDGVSRTDDMESMKFGKLIDFSVANYHFTASAGAILDERLVGSVREQLTSLIGETVRWEELAEGGQTFVEDGKTYALIPWWRLIGVSDGE